MKVLLWALCLSISSAFATPEQFLAQKLAKKEMNFKNVAQKFKYEGKTYKLSDFDDFIHENKREILLSMDIDEAKDFVKNYIAAKAHVIKSNTKSVEKQLVLATLEYVVPKIYASGGKKVLETMIQECREPVQKFPTIEAIVAKVEKTRETEQCKALSPGEHKVFKKKEAYTSGNYLLKRLSNGSYEASVNVRFHAENGSIGSEDMLKRAKGCLAEASRAMKGPNGEKLELKILSPEEVDKLPSDERPAQNLVKIQGPNYQTDAANYNEKVDCATITHETLHLLGLCDEYKETRPQFAQYKWTCRVVTKTPTIMNDLAAYRDAVPEAINCECTTDTCKGVRDSRDKNLRKLYTTVNAYDVIPVKYRTEYCKETQNKGIHYEGLENPDKGVLVESEESHSFTLDNRNVSSLNREPYYQVVKNKMTCTCPRGDDTCLGMKKFILKQIKKPGIKPICPPHTRKISTAPSSKTNKANFDYDVLTIHPKPVSASLLQPAHFNKILNGNCQGASDSYNECASHAYKSEPCNVPSKCNSDEYYLGSRQ